MLKQLLYTLLISASSYYISHAQSLLTEFDWENPLLTPLSAVNGLSATSISSGGLILPGGKNGSYGLAPTTGNLNLDLPVDSQFDQPGLDFSIDFLRKEKKANFFSRSGFEFGIKNGALFVSFTIDDGAGGSTQINSGQQVTIPEDNVWRTFRFFYLPDLGIGELLVDGATIWSFAGFPNRNMVWQSDGFRIGEFANAKGTGAVIFDNMSIHSVSGSALPVELTNFSISMQNIAQVDLVWQTASEINNDRFDIEKSTDGVTWTTIGERSGAGNSQDLIQYEFTDYDAQEPVQYYRLKQFDIDGKETVSAIVSYTRSDEMDLKVFPNPTDKFIYIEAFDLDFTVIRIADLQGNFMNVPIDDLSFNKKRLDLGDLPPGTYILIVGDISNRVQLL